MSKLRSMALIQFRHQLVLGSCHQCPQMRLTPTPKRTPTQPRRYLPYRLRFFFFFFQAKVSERIHWEAVEFAVGIVAPNRYLAGDPFL